MNTSEKFLLNFWTSDERGGDSEDHPKERFTKIYSELHILMTTRIKGATTSRFQDFDAF